MLTFFIHFGLFARPIIGFQAGFYSAPPPPPTLLLSLFNGPFFRTSALLSTERLQTHVCTTITKIFVLSLSTYQQFLGFWQTFENQFWVFQERTSGATLVFY